MSGPIYFPNLKKDGERPVATGTKVTVGLEDKAGLDVNIIGGAASGPLQFTLDAATVTVTEDTVTPANNIPLPVKIMDGGEVTLTAANLDVQLEHDGANPDSVQIGDGTEILLITAAGEATVSLTTELPAGTQNIGDVDVLSVIPGVGATNLGKADAAAFTAGDVGVMAMVVDNAGNYVPLTLNASGELPVTNAAVAALDILDFLDVPLLDTSSTNIPASASVPVTVVASLASAIKKIQFMDTTGLYIGLYSDPAGAAVLEAIIGPGSDSTVDVALSATTVLGLRNMENSVISVGLFSANFIG